MKLFKEILFFFSLCFLFSFLTKVAINHLTFNVDYMIDAIFISLGSTFGYFTYMYLKKRIDTK